MGARNPPDGFIVPSTA